MNLDLEKVHDREVLLFLNMCKKEDGNFLNLPLKKRKIEDAVRLLCITTALSLRGPFFSVINAEEKRFDELISPLETNPLRRKESDRVARRLHRRRRRSPAETSRPRIMERKKSALSKCAFRCNVFVIDGKTISSPNFYIVFFPHPAKNCLPSGRFGCIVYAVYEY